jgi:glutamine cyclotransferase
MKRVMIIAVLGVMSMLVLPTNAQRSKSSTPVYGYTVVNSFPHDPQAFTQGLSIRDGR